MSGWPNNNTSSGATLRQRHADPAAQRTPNGVTSSSPAIHPTSRARTQQTMSAQNHSQGTATALVQQPHPTPEWIAKVNELYLSLMDALPYSLVQYCIPHVEPEKKNAVDELKIGRIVAFSDTDPAHMDLLRRLWEGHHRVAFSSPALIRFDPAQHRPHEAWKEMGFQGLDPSTDFRGAGCFALEQLVYLVEKHPDSWSRFLTPDFLLGAAGVNVTMRLMSLLEWSNGANVIDAQRRGIVFSRRRAQCRLVEYILSADDAARDTPQARMVRLHEVYCTYMTLLHDRWMRSTKNLMAFNSMLNETDQEVVQRLCQCDSLATFQAALA